MVKEEKLSIIFTEGSIDLGAVTSHVIKALKKVKAGLPKKQEAIIYQFEEDKKFGQEFINKEDAEKTIDFLIRMMEGKVKII